MKNKKVNIIILFIALFLVLYFTLKDNFYGVIHELSKVNILIFLLALLLMMISLLVKSVSLKIFISEHKKEFNLKNAFSLTLIGQFLNGITPFSSGGQPFQIYLLKKDGVRISDSTSSMLKDFIVYQIALISVGVFAFIYNVLSNSFSKNTYLNTLILLGFLINIIVLVILLLISSAKKTGLKISKKIVHFVCNLKFLKSLKEKEEEIVKSLERFYKTGSELRKNKKKIIIGVFYNIIYLILMHIVPFVIFLSLGVKTSLIEVICLSTFVMLIGNFIPVPGATGGLEYGFMQFFGIIVKDIPVLSGAMLLWRFVTYFLGMIVGFITLIIKKGTCKK